MVIQLLLGDFVHHNVELVAVLLETCGRWDNRVGMGLVYFSSPRPLEST